MNETETIRGKTFVAKKQSRKSLEFDMNDEASMSRFAKMVNGLQSQGTAFSLQQDGDTVWIDFA